MLKSFEIGYETNDEQGTGVTVVLAKKGAIGGVSVRGASPATRETELLRDGKTVQKINAVVLSGGSAFGLESCSGVMQYLYENGFGYNAGEYKVPIVVGASLYDLEYKGFAFPSKSDGYAACEAAKSDNFLRGDFGAGAGATISKACGMSVCCKAGLGYQTLKINDLEIAVIVAVNALGDIVKDGKIILGAKNYMGEFIDSRRVFSMGTYDYTNQNTTIGVILTNAKLTKEECNIIADLAHDGFALALSPAHTAYDGDAMFCMASGEVEAPINMLSGVIAPLTAEAIQSCFKPNEEKSNRVSRIMWFILKKAFKRKKK